MDARALLIAAAAGTALQVAMVAAGHQHAAIKPFFGPGGVGISLAAGLLFALLAPAAGWTPVVAGGTLAGGLCALLGIALSYALGDVPLALLAFGTLASAAAGLSGAALGKLIG